MKPSTASKYRVVVRAEAILLLLTSLVLGGTLTACDTRGIVLQAETVFRTGPAFSVLDSELLRGGHVVPPRDSTVRRHQPYAD